MLHSKTQTAQSYAAAAVRRPMGYGHHPANLGGTLQAALPAQRGANDQALADDRHAARDAREDDLPRGSSLINAFTLFCHAQQQTLPLRLPLAAAADEPSQRGVICTGAQLTAHVAANIKTSPARLHMWVTAGAECRRIGPATSLPALAADQRLARRDERVVITFYVEAPPWWLGQQVPSLCDGCAAAVAVLRDMVFAETDFRRVQLLNDHTELILAGPDAAGITDAHQVAEGLKRLGELQAPFIARLLGDPALQCCGPVPGASVEQDANHHRVARIRFAELWARNALPAPFNPLCYVGAPAAFPHSSGGGALAHWSPLPDDNVAGPALPNSSMPATDLPASASPPSEPSPARVLCRAAVASGPPVAIADGDAEHPPSCDVAVAPAAVTAAAEDEGTPLHSTAEAPGKKRRRSRKGQRNQHRAAATAQADEVTVPHAAEGAAHPAPAPSLEDDATTGSAADADAAAASDDEDVAHSIIAESALSDVYDGASACNVSLRTPGAPGEAGDAPFGDAAAAADHVTDGDPPPPFASHRGGDATTTAVAAAEDFLSADAPHNDRTASDGAPAGDVVDVVGDTIATTTAAASTKKNDAAANTRERKAQQRKQQEQERKAAEKKKAEQKAKAAKTKAAKAKAEEDVLLAEAEAEAKKAEKEKRAQEQAARAAEKKANAKKAAELQLLPKQRASAIAGRNGAPPNAHTSDGAAEAAPTRHVFNSTAVTEADERRLSLIPVLFAGCDPFHLPSAHALRPLLGAPHGDSFYADGVFTGEPSPGVETLFAELRSGGDVDAAFDAAEDDTFLAIAAVVDAADPSPEQLRTTYVDAVIAAALIADRVFCEAGGDRSQLVALPWLPRAVEILQLLLFSAAKLQQRGGVRRVWVDGAFHLGAVRCAKCLVAAMARWASPCDCATCEEPPSQHCSCQVFDSVFCDDHTAAFRDVALFTDVPEQVHVAAAMRHLAGMLNHVVSPARVLLRPPKDMRLGETLSVAQPGLFALVRAINARRGEGARAANADAAELEGMPAFEEAGAM